MTVTIVFMMPQATSFLKEHQIKQSEPILYSESMDGLCGLCGPAATRWGDVGTVVLPSPIDQIWTYFEGKKFKRKELFLVSATAETKIVLKHKLPNTDYRRCTR